MRADCPDENLLVQLAEGLLAPAEMAVAEHHLDGCADCSEILADLMREIVPAQEQTALDRPWMNRGDTVARYVVLRWIGSGGMGQVYVADDPDLDRRVALKLVRGVSSPALEHRLLREARAMARLAHPNVVSIHDVGTEDGRAYIAMELVAGITLQSWLSEPHSWREVLRYFVAAGRGLAAAHNAEVVHRDFKPGNVLVGADGRVLVTDFGLATDLSGEPSFSDSQPAPPAARQLAVAGSNNAGTPAYMAPEQLRGEAADHRADQYSFCVALREAIYGELPATLIPGRNLSASPPPPLAANRMRVPAAIRRALTTGLQQDREHRFPSMTVLLDTLERVPVRRRQFKLLATGIVILSLAVAATAYGVRSPRPAALCRAAYDHTNELWSPARKHGIAQAFTSTELPYAAAAWDKVRETVDRYTAQYTAEHEQACLATRVQGGQSDHVLELRMQCLQQRFDELAAVLSQLDAADAPIVENAVQAVGDLAPVTSCRAAALRTRGIRLPTAPALRAKVEVQFRALAEARALRALGKLDEALAATEVLAKHASELGFRRLEAEVLDELRGLTAFTGAQRDSDLPYRALWAARAAGAPLFEGRAAIALATRAAARGTFDEASMWLRFTAATIEALGGDTRLELEREEAAATLAGYQGDARTAVQHYRRAIELAPEVPTITPADLAETYTYLGSALASLGEHQAAIAAHQRSMELLSTSLGPEHPRMLATMNNLAVAYDRVGRTDDAVQLQRRSLALRERSFGPDSPRVANSLVNLALGLHSQGHHEGARQHLERAVTIFEQAPGGSNRSLAIALLNLGTELVDLGQLPLAQQQLERAGPLISEELGVDHPLFASYLVAQAQLFTEQGEHHRALANYRQAHDLQAAALGSDHPELAATLLGWGETLLALQQPAQARPVLERALAISDSTSPNTSIAAACCYALAQSLWPISKQRPRAIQLAERAAARFGAIGDTSTEHQVTHWLDTHQAP